MIDSGMISSFDLFGHLIAKEGGMHTDQELFIL